MPPRRSRRSSAGQALLDAAQENNAPKSFANAALAIAAAAVINGSHGLRRSARLTPSLISDGVSQPLVASVLTPKLKKKPVRKAASKTIPDATPKTVPNTNLPSPELSTVHPGPANPRRPPVVDEEYELEEEDLLQEIDDESDVESIAFPPVPRAVFSPVAVPIVVVPTVSRRAVSVPTFTLRPPTPPALSSLQFRTEPMNRYERRDNLRERRSRVNYSTVDQDGLEESQLESEVPNFRPDRIITDRPELDKDACIEIKREEIGDLFDEARNSGDQPTADSSSGATCAAHQNVVDLDYIQPLLSPTIPKLLQRYSRRDLICVVNLLWMLFIVITLPLILWLMSWRCKVSNTTMATRAPFPYHYREQFSTQRIPIYDWPAPLRATLENYGKIIDADSWLMENCILPRNIINLPLVTCQDLLPWYNLTVPQVLWLNERSSWGYTLNYDITEEFNTVYDMQFELQELQTSWILSADGPSGSGYHRKRCAAVDDLREELRAANGGPPEAQAPSETKAKAVFRKWMEPLRLFSWNSLAESRFRKSELASTDVVIENGSGLD